MDDIFAAEPGEHPDFLFAQGGPWDGLAIPFAFAKAFVTGGEAMYGYAFGRYPTGWGTYTYDITYSAELARLHRGEPAPDDHVND